jgi:hypothetical protein
VLEVVDVEDDQRHEVVRLGRARELVLQALAEEPEVVEPRERVGDGALVRAREAAGQAAHARHLLPVEPLQHVGPPAQDLLEAGRAHLEDAAAAARAHGGGAALAVGRDLAHHRHRLHGAQHHLLLFARLVHDLEQPVEQEHHGVAGVALLPQQRAFAQLLHLAFRRQLGVQLLQDRLGGRGRRHIGHEGASIIV